MLKGMKADIYSEAFRVIYSNIFLAVKDTWSNWEFPYVFFTITNKWLGFFFWGGKEFRIENVDKILSSNRGVPCAYNFWNCPFFASQIWHSLFSTLNIHSLKKSSISLSKNCRLFEIMSNPQLSSIKGFCTSYPQIKTFCALSQNYQHLFEKYSYTPTQFLVFWLAL